MFNPVRYYQKRLEMKRKVFNPDKKTLNLQALNRFVNGAPEKQRTAPTYLRAKTRDLLWSTLVKEWGDGKYGKDLDEVANDLIAWCKSPRRAQNTNVRHWLKQLAEAKPVECPEVGSVKVESVKMPTWTVAQLIRDFGGDVQLSASSEDVAQSHVSSEDVAQPGHTPEEDYDWSGMFEEALNGTASVIPNVQGAAEFETESAGGSNEEIAPFDSVSARKSDRDDVVNKVETKINSPQPRPGPRLRPPTATPSRGVVHMVDGEVVPVKK